jgi:hypothetical protein
MLEELCGSNELTDLVDGPSVSTLLENHRSGLADNSELLWSILNFAVWRQTYRA